MLQECFIYLCYAGEQDLTLFLLCGIISRLTQFIVSSNEAIKFVYYLDLACLWINPFNSLFICTSSDTNQVSHSISKLFVWKFTTVVWIKSSKKIKYSPAVFIHPVHHTLLEVVKNLSRGDQTVNLRSTNCLFEDQTRGRRLKEEIFEINWRWLVRQKAWKDFAIELILGQTLLSYLSVSEALLRGS